MSPAISKQGVLSQSLVLLHRSRPSSDGWWQGTRKKGWKSNETGIRVPVWGGSPPTSRGESILGGAVRLVPFTFTTPGPPSSLPPPTSSEYEHLSLSRNPEARIRMTAGCVARRGQALRGTGISPSLDSRNPLDSRKARPQASQEAGPVSPLASTEHDAWPSD